MSKTTRINLWSCPRNVSTAMMYSWAQRPDTVIFDEPLYAHFLINTGIEHPGKTATLASQNNDGETVVTEILLGKIEKPVAFFKQMTHHLVALDWQFMLGMQNLIFIREPAYILNSYTKVITEPTMLDIGVKKQKELYEYLSTNDKPPLLVDSHKFLRNPKQQLSKICAHFDIPFYQEMLEWKAGPRPEDGSWAKYWYSNVHQSTGFKPFVEKEILLPKHLQSLNDEATFYYKQLLDKAI